MGLVAHWQAVNTGVESVRAILAPAKVNLVLEVGAQRPDGYHELATLFQSISLYDRITLCEIDGDLDLVVSGPQAAVLQHVETEENLVCRAARLLSAAVGRPRPGVRIELEKRVPVAAGLGGGSTDAAAVLLGLAQAWGVQDPGLLQELACSLGSDVAFFLSGGTAIGRGRGELLTRVVLPPLWLVLANPGRRSSTADVYRTFSEHKGAGRPQKLLGWHCDAMINVLRREGPGGAGALLHNDLAEAAYMVTPEMLPLRAALAAAGAIGVQVSGSGATLFGLATDASHAAEIESRIRSIAAWTWWGSSLCL